MKVVPGHQAHWDLRAAANFIGGGSGTGLLLAACLAVGESAWRMQASIALALIGAGLLCVWAEIGRPLRAGNVFFHPQTSWMTREAMVAPLLLGAGALALWTGTPALGRLAALIGLVFLYCQARMLQASKGIPAWREPRVILLLISSALAEGLGLAALLTLLMGATSEPLAYVLLGALLLRRMSWRFYLAALERRGAPQRTLDVLRRFSTPFLRFGQWLPELLVLAAMFLYRPWLLPVAGMAAVASGWALKVVLVTRAAYTQGYALPTLPVRGCGSLVPGVKPGWSAAVDEPAARLAGVAERLP